METKIQKDFDYSIEKAREYLKSMVQDNVNHQGFSTHLDGDSIVYVNDKIKHKKTEQPLTFKVEIGLDNIGELNGEFPVKYKNEQGEFVPAISQSGEPMVLKGGQARRNVEKWKQDKEKQIGDLIWGCAVVLFYNNWNYSKEPLENNY